MPEEQVVTLPDGVAGEAGACLGMPAMTAFHAILTDGGVSSQCVLIAGGAGAVGHYAIQFARLLGAARIIATVSSADKAVLAREAGATTVIDYRSQNVVQSVLEATSGVGVERIVEVDLTANAAIDLDVIRREGLLVVYGRGARQVNLPFFALSAKGVLARFFTVYHLNAADRDRATTLLTQWPSSGVLTHNIAARYPLDETALAYTMVEHGRPVGNVVLSID